MADKFSLRNWVGGRSGRKEYWLWVAILFATGFGLSYLPGASGTGIGLSLLLIVVEIRRLHDAGRTGWWSAPANVVPVVVSIALTVMASLDMAILAGFAVEAAGMLLIGFLPPSPGENRFGPAMPFGWSRMLRGR